ncbi:MAG: isochorismatase family protein [Ruminococcaceae bacterium]|nr:isochorismatase family protein [Oscillospiraceae bacterium]
MGIFSGMERVVNENTLNIRKILLDPDRTAMINVNTSDGFFKKGPFVSSHMSSAIKNLVRINEYLLHCRRVFAVDYHNPKSAEFRTFPEHCTTDESCQIIEELDKFASSSDIVVKNCANAMFSNAFLRWFADNADTLDNFIIVGAHTDIDVMQLALSLRSYFNERDRSVKIIVVLNACRTFAAESHNADDFHTFAAYNMLLNGITCANV